MTWSRRTQTIIEEDMCLICGETTERTLYILCDYSVVWQGNKQQCVLRMQPEDTQEWLMQVCRSNSDEGWGRVFASAYLLWRNINNVMHGKNTWNASNFLWLISQQVMEIKCIPEICPSPSHLIRKLETIASWLNENKYGCSNWSCDAGWRGSYSCLSNHKGSHGFIIKGIHL